MLFHLLCKGAEVSSLELCDSPDTNSDLPHMNRYTLRLWLSRFASLSTLTTLKVGINYKGGLSASAFSRNSAHEIVELICELFSASSSLRELCFGTDNPAAAMTID